MKVLDIKDLMLLQKKKKKKNQPFVPSLCSKSQGNTEIRYRKTTKIIHTIHGLVRCARKRKYFVMEYFI